MVSVSEDLSLHHTTASQMNWLWFVSTVRLHELSLRILTLSNVIPYHCNQSVHYGLDTQCIFGGILQTNIT